MGWLPDESGGGFLPAPPTGPGIPGGGGPGGFPTIPGMPGGGGGMPGVPGMPGIAGGGMPAFGDWGVPGSPGFSAYNSFLEKQNKNKQNRIESADERLMQQYGGIPQLGGRTSMGDYDQNGKLILKGGAYLNPNDYQGNQAALQALNAKSMQSGPSAWAQMQGQKLNLEQQNQLNAAARQAQGQNMQARSALAMRGGLSGGAAERLSRAGMQDINAARQGVMNQGSQNRLNLGIQDEANKSQLLGQAVNANMAQNAQNIGMGQFNVQNTLAENQANNAQNLARYQEQMKGFSAGKSANAIANSGKK